MSTVLLNREIPGSTPGECIFFNPISNLAPDRAVNFREISRHNRSLIVIVSSGVKLMRLLKSADPSSQKRSARDDLG